MALSIGLDTAVKALRAHQLAVDVASHNIANAHTPGFSRQRVLLRPIGLEGAAWSSRDSLLGKAGFGVDARDVNRVRDAFMDFQARQALSARGEHSAFATPLRNAETVFNDPSDDGLASLLARFWGAWHDVANEPESSAARTALVHAAQTLAVRFQSAYGEIDLQRRNLNQQVSSLADEINSYAREIAGLNLQIKQVELNGDMANDLRDRRDLLLDKLAEVASIQYSEADTGEVSVYLGSHELVFGTTARTIVPIQDPLDPTMVKLTWQVDGFDVVATGGKLKGVLDARDVALPALLGKLNTLAGALINDVNTLHQSGYALDGSTTGLAFFTGTDASNISVNTLLISDPKKVAAASSAAGAPGDGSNALAIAGLQRATSPLLGNVSISDYYSNIVAVLGADVNRALGNEQSASLLVDHLDTARQSVHGVNIDEEVVNLNAAQHAYNAAARVITVIDDMLDTLINRTGVTR